MTWLLVVVAGLAWVAVGSSGFAYWWTRTSDLRVGDAVMAVVMGVAMGPLTWGVGAFIHGGNRVLVRKAVTK